MAIKMRECEKHGGVGGSRCTSRDAWGTDCTARCAYVNSLERRLKRLEKILGWAIPEETKDETTGANL